MEEEGIWKLQRKFVKDKQTNTVTVSMEWVVGSLLFFLRLFLCPVFRCRELSKPRRQRQRECDRQTKDSMSRTVTIAVHVRYNVLYISLLSSVKQQREITNSALCG